MRRPWNPWNLVLATFFGGPLGGGWLLAHNFSRLGERRKEPWCMLAFVWVALLLSLAFVWWKVLGPGAGATGPGSRTIPRLIMQGGSTLAAVVVASMQARRYRLFELSGGQPGKLLGVAIRAILIGTLIHTALQLALLALLAP